MNQERGRLLERRHAGPREGVVVEEGGTAIGAKFQIPERKGPSNLQPKLFKWGSYSEVRSVRRDVERVSATETFGEIAVYNQPA
jgi:hypothetical protein